MRVLRSAWRRYVGMADKQTPNLQECLIGNTLGVLRKSKIKLPNYVSLTHMKQWLSDKRLNNRI